MKFWNRALAGGLSALLALSLTAPALAVGERGFDLTILTTAAMSGKISDEDPLTGETVEDSYLKVPAAAKAAAGDATYTLLVDVGDVTASSPILAAAAESSAGETHPLAAALRYCGYTAYVPGSYDFDRAPSAARRFYEDLDTLDFSDPTNPVAVVCANYLDRQTQEPRLSPYTVTRYGIPGSEENFTVGVLGFTDADMAQLCAKGAYDDASFAHAGNAEGSYAYEWINHWQRKLREEEGCDFVVAALHTAVGDGTLTPQAQAAHLIAHTSGIDLVVAGHEAAGVQSLKNAQGKDIPVVSGGGEALTATTLHVKRDKTYTLDKSALVSLADYGSDAALKARLGGARAAAAAFVEEELATLAGPWRAEPDLFCAQSTAVDLIHAAQLWASGADISLVSPDPAEGFTLGRSLAEGESASFTWRDCYDLIPSRDALVTVKMTGRQLKDWLEVCMAHYAAPDGRKVTGGQGADQLCGITYLAFLSNAEGKRVVSMDYEGEPVTENQTFTVALPASRLTQADWLAATGITAEKILWTSARDSRFAAYGGERSGILAEYVRTAGSQGGELTVPKPRSQWKLYPGESAEGLTQVTRLAFVRTLRQLSGDDPEKVYPAAPVTDVTGDPDVNWAWAMGITNGNGSGQFLPGETITREQAIVMILRYDRARGVGPTGSDWMVRVPYADAADSNPWAAEALMWNVIKGYLTPNAEEKLRPQDKLLLCELGDMTADLLSRM